MFRCPNETSLINNSSNRTITANVHHYNMATKTLTKLATAANNDNNNGNGEINTIVQTDQRQQPQQLHTTLCDMIGQSSPTKLGTNALLVDQNNKTTNNEDFKHCLLVGTSQPMDSGGTNSNSSSSRSSAFGKFY